MQSVCVQVDASTTDCTYQGTTTTAMQGPVEAFDPFLDVVLGTSLWIMVCVVVVALIVRFR